MPDSNALMQEVVITGNVPGAPNGSSPSTPGQRVTVRAKPTREYAAAGGYAFLANYARSLSWAVDDLTSQWGSDLYERMMLDSAVCSAVNVLRVGILEDGLRLAPKVSEEGKDGYDQSVRLVAFVERVLDELDGSIDDVLWNLLDAIALGNKVAELVYAPDDSYDLPAGGAALILRAIKVKPRESTAFVVDSYDNVLGLLARIPGIAFPVQHGTMLTDLGDAPNLLPREKFAILTFRPRDSDPRGTSVLRAAYDPWYRKVQMIPEHLKYLTQFASPIPIGFLPQEAMYETTDDAEGNPAPDATTGVQGYSDPAQDMANALATIRNGAALSFPYGALVQLLQSGNDGGAFLSAFDQFDREITHAILHQTLATMEGQHMARAAATVHADTKDTVVRQGKNSVVRMIHRDILQQMVFYNFGPAWVRWTPQVSLGNTERSDLTGLLNSFAVAGYTLDPSQFPGVDTMLNMPVRTVTAPLEPPTAPTGTPPDGTATPPATAPALAPAATPAMPTPGRTGRGATGGTRPQRSTPATHPGT